MLLVGLTGGIASGKSTVAARMAERGATVVDADVLAREVVAPGEAALDAVVVEFGEDVLRSDGTLDRAALGRVVFADAERRAALNAIVHPAVGERTAARLAALEAQGAGLVVHDVPLLVENGLADAYAAVVVVAVPPDVQVARLVGDRAMAPLEARQRVDAQASLEERLAVATHVIWNTSDLEALRRRTDEVVDALL